MTRKNSFAIQDVIEVTRFSKLIRLLRVKAYVLRFIRNCRTVSRSRNSGSITLQELENAEMLLIRQCQQNFYSEELSNLQSGKSRLLVKYWIPTIRQCVKSLLRKCTICLAPDPPSLPTYRVKNSSPFAVTGIDFSGALYVRGESGRESKTYVCLFTCAATRAVHLELVHDLTDDSFMQAFRRFVSRRSFPRLIISDNATTYHAASNTLNKMFESQTLKDQLNSTGTEWRFIPNRSPWFGGWWERMIGLVKTTLKKVLARSFVTYGSLQTILTEIEAVLNDRPLTYVTSDTSDPEPLTPPHLLYGRRITTPGDYSAIQNVNSNHNTANKQVRIQRELLNRFWERWKTDYLTSLRERHTQSGQNKQTIKVGDVVQVHEDCPRLRWKLAVVEELMPGKNGLTRSAMIRTGSGLTTRAIKKLYPLELNENERQ
ncbi:uncharacterized protein LOC123558274 [Mercenaria mercenaria]|uniref:uncharacterized protein LOC123558274 n=1 Tax=Mercenaria mercenaria TaxID=6596 RepID=UPI00234F3397|nr:uncharacterized protein LOC123558274 [Mercenaria mercenaria]